MRKKYTKHNTFNVNKCTCAQNKITIVYIIVKASVCVCMCSTLVEKTKNGTR